MRYNLHSVLLAIGLAACSGAPIKINVSGAKNDIRFSAAASKGASLACVNKLSVTPVTPDEAEPHWQVVSTDPTKCISTVRYGTPTGDFAENAPAASLVANVIYRVRLSGAGFSEVRDFRLTPEGAVIAN